MQDVLAAVADGPSILPQMAPQLSRHLLFPLIEFEAGQAEEQGDDAKARRILAGKIKMLEDTNMSDYVAGLYTELHGKDAPAEYGRKRQEVLAQLERYEQETALISELLGREDVVGGLRSDKVANLEFLKKEHNVSIEMVNALYDFGQFQFRCGNYAAASELLYQFRVLSTDNDRVAAATWGKLASDILTTQWDAAVEELQKVRESIDSKLFNNPRAQLDHRTMLAHWALYPLFNHEAARDAILEMLFSPAYINTIQTSCPWILRYVIAAVVTGGRSRGRSSSLHQKQMKDVVRYVRQEAYEYADPVTEFVSALYVAHDFDAARVALRRAEAVCRADFFLCGASDAFVDAARHLICESYCKIFSRMNIRDLSAKLGLNPEDGEKWIVNLIRETRLDAKIDSQDGTVVMNHPPNNVYQQVIEKTKGGFFRTQVLSAAVSK